MTQLTVHSGTKRVNRQQVAAVPVPARTKTWKPVSHSLVIDAAEYAINRLGTEIVGSEYSLSPNGKKMFFVYSLKQHVGDINIAIGGRNSHDKSFAIGICGGTKIFVCDNLAFYGDFTYLQKHYGSLDTEKLFVDAAIAVNKSFVHGTAFSHWMVALEKVFMTANARKQFVYDCIYHGIFPPSRFQKFLYAESRTAEELEPKRRGTLYHYYNAVTRLYREDNLFTVAKTTDKLNRLSDSYRKAA